MQQDNEYIAKKVTSFHVEAAQIWPGSEEIKLSLGNGKDICFHATYVGVEPVTSLVRSLIYLDRYQCDEIIWDSEPGWIKFSIELISENLLSMKITGDESIKQQNILISYDVYKRGVIDVALRVLKEYGCKGFNNNWADECSAFFIGELLSVMNLENKFCDDNNYHSIITEELNILLNAYDKHCENSK